MKLEEFYVCIIRAHAVGFALLLNEDRSVAGYSTLQRGLDNFTRMYEAAHRRGYQGSMGACLNFMFFQPAIVHVKSLDEITAWCEKPMKAMAYRCEAGDFLGCPLIPAIAEPVWNEGHKPELISA